MIKNIKTDISNGAKELYGKDKGDLVQTIIIVAGFAVAAIVAIGMLSSTLMNKGEAVAGCISGSSNFTSGAQAKNNCEKADGNAQKKSGQDIKDNGGSGKIVGSNGKAK